MSSFNRPDASDDVKKQIDELEMDIADLEERIGNINPTSDLDQVRANMAIMQRQIAVLNTALDHAARQGNAILLVLSISITFLLCE